jgi:xanthine/uracil permease
VTEFLNMFGSGFLQVLRILGVVIVGYIIWALVVYTTGKYWYRAKGEEETSVIHKFSKFLKQKEEEKK